MLAIISKTTETPKLEVWTKGFPNQKYRILIVYNEIGAQ